MTTAVLYDAGVEVASHAQVIRTRGFDADVNVDSERPTIAIKSEKQALFIGEHV